MYPLKYEEIIILNSKEYNLSTQLIASVINVESGFKKNEVSTKGAIGLMQIMPTTAIWIAEKLSLDTSNITENLKDPEFNINLGCYYFKYLIKKFEDVNTALFAYNAGEGNVINWLKDKRYSTDGKVLNSCPYDETNNYVKKVNRNIRVYENKI